MKADQDVHIAVRAEVIAQNRSKQANSAFLHFRQNSAILPSSNEIRAPMSVAPRPNPAFYPTGGTDSTVHPPRAHCYLYTHLRSWVQVISVPATQPSKRIAGGLSQTRDGDGGEPTM